MLKQVQKSHRQPQMKTDLESISLRCRLWCFSVKPWLSSYLFGMYLFPPEGKGRNASGDSGCCRGIKLWHLILVAALVWAWKMSSKCDWTVTLWIIVSNFESRFRIAVLGVLKGTQKESHKIQVSFENSCSCLTQATEAAAPAAEAAFSWFSDWRETFCWSDVDVSCSWWTHLLSNGLWCFDGVIHCSEAKTETPAAEASMGNQADGSVFVDMFNQRNSVSCILEVFRTADSFFHPLL